ncbi:MAG: hypothetical protein OXN93_11695 [bacterium]|nr:hypothetical protein [bacterium]
MLDQQQAVIGGIDCHTDFHAVAAPPAAAHDLYHYASQQKQRCTYDPFAGNQCWTETVSVQVPSHHSHAQACPPGTTGAHPDCYPTPPTNDPVTDTPDNDWTDPEPDPVEPDTSQPDTSDPDPVDPDPVGPDPVDPDPVDPGTGTGTAYTVKPCTPWQDPLETYQRHRHPLGGGADAGCHRHDSSHCPAGHTEQGAHGAQDCRRNDNPDTIATRIQHIIETGAVKVPDTLATALKKVMEYQGEAALNEAELNVVLGKEIEKFWFSLPPEARAVVAGVAACAALVGAVAGSVATGPDDRDEEPARAGCGPGRLPHGRPELL